MFKYKIKNLLNIQNNFCSCRLNSHDFADSFCLGSLLFILLLSDYLGFSVQLLKLSVNRSSTAFQDVLLLAYGSGEIRIIRIRIIKNFHCRFLIDND